MRDYARKEEAATCVGVKLRCTLGALPKTRRWNSPRQELSRQKPHQSHRPMGTQILAVFPAAAGVCTCLALLRLLSALNYELRCSFAPQPRRPELAGWTARLELRWNESCSSLASQRPSKSASPRIQRRRGSWRDHIVIRRGRFPVDQASRPLLDTSLLESLGDLLSPTAIHWKP